MAFLRKTLGADAIPCPALNIGTAIADVVATALGGEASSYKAFSPYASDLDLLLGAPAHS